MAFSIHSRVVVFFFYVNKPNTWLTARQTTSLMLKAMPQRNVGVCSSNSLATRWGTRNLIYILAFILLILLTTSAYSTSTLLFSILPSSSIVAVLIAKAGHVWVSWPELGVFLLYIFIYIANIATGLLLLGNRLAYTPPQLIRSALNTTNNIHEKISRLWLAKRNAVFR